MPATTIPQEPVRLAMDELVRDPYPLLAMLREQAPAVAIENNGYRMWLVTRHDDVRRLLADRSVVRDLIAHRHEINQNCIVRPMPRAHLPQGSRRSFFDRDGEDHHRLRGLVGNVFTPARLERFRTKLDRLVAELLDGLPVGEPFDLMARYCRPIAITMIGDLVGIPEDSREGIPILATEMVTSPVIAEIEQAARLLYGFAVEMAALKRAEPAEDLFTELLKLREQDLMSEEELTSTYILMLVGGSEPATAIGNGVVTLLRYPEQLAGLLAEPAGFEEAAEEVIRFESPFRLLPPRYTTEQVELEGVTIPAGELVLFSPAAANRDPARYPDPDTFDAQRCPRGHLGFGHGPHRCVGNALGRMETSIGLRELFRRYPRIQLAQPFEEADWRPGKFMRRLDTLPVLIAGEPPVGQGIGATATA